CRAFFYSLSLRMVSSTPSDVCALRLPKRFCGVKGEQVDWEDALCFIYSGDCTMPHQYKIDRIFRPKPSITELDVQHGFISRSSYKRSDSQRL
ncbi:hypothetical protein EDB89DRAFT_1955123, partial [Lactarius sanguifluus]